MHAKKPSNTDSVGEGESKVASSSRANNRRVAAFFHTTMSTTSTTAVSTQKPAQDKTRSSASLTSPPPDGPKPPPPNQLQVASRPSSSGKGPQPSGNTAGKKPDNPSKKSNLPPAPVPQLTQRTESSLMTVIGQSFPAFDHQGLIVGPFTEETSRDTTFEQELGAMLLDVLLETHAWAAARPKYESQITVQKLEQKIGDVIELEKDQGMSPTPRPTLVSRSSSSSILVVAQSLPTLFFGRHHLDVCCSTNVIGLNLRQAC
ncbi:hypothetical protein D9758_003391 [Tetrapyrgos nigripes]|uniref:Uncharacterized protein n=1 Tax=Tetrapyrgos nigripes TaxID=182062 RepID=A0A8H5GUY5_9AGAR|nr:hypothetical protein D9758_003391 [Tetrapyrgos nigripes]